MIISIVGYAKSGKTSFAEYVIREATSRGVHVAALKTGRVSHDGVDHRSASSFTARDSERLREAGAEVSVFWSRRGIEIIGALNETYPTPLPDRSTFYRSWQSCLPHAVRSILEERSLLVIEGRPVLGAAVAQMRKQSAPEEDALKYPVTPTHSIVADSESFSSVAAFLLAPLERGGYVDAGTRR